MRQITKDNFDNFLKAKGEFFVMHKHQIRPSAGFVGETLDKLKLAYMRRVRIEKILVVVYLFIPAMMRELWLLTRHDYFSVGGWPFARHIVGVYHFLIASSTGIYILILGAVASLMYLWGFRALSPVFKYVAHFFSREQRARA